MGACRHISRSVSSKFYPRKFLCHNGADGLRVRWCRCPVGTVLLVLSWQAPKEGCQMTEATLKAHGGRSYSVWAEMQVCPGSSSPAALTLVIFFHCSWETLFLITKVKYSRLKNLANTFWQRKPHQGLTPPRWDKFCEHLLHAHLNISLLLSLALLSGYWLCPCPLIRIACFSFLPAVFQPKTSACMTAAPFCPGHTARLCFCQLPWNRMQQGFWCTITFYSFVCGYCGMKQVLLRGSNMLRFHIVQAISPCWKALSDPTGGAGAAQILWFKQFLLLSPLLCF